MRGGLRPFLKAVLSAPMLTIAMTGLASADQPLGGAPVSGWRLLRTQAAGGTEAVAVVHTADTGQSDLDLAGLMIRCGEHLPEALVVVVEPRPPGARPRVTLRADADRREFVATVVAPFSAILLPADAAALITGPWQGRPAISIRVEGADRTISGVIPMAGLAEALHTLAANCPPLR